MTLNTDCSALRAFRIIGAVNTLYLNDGNMKSTYRKEKTLAEKTLTFLYEYYRIKKHVYRSVRVRACEYAYHC